MTTIEFPESFPGGLIAWIDDGPIPMCPCPPEDVDLVGRQCRTCGLPNLEALCAWRETVSDEHWEALLRG